MGVMTKRRRRLFVMAGLVRHRANRILQRQFESVANRIFADFYKKFFARVAKIPKKAKIKSAGFLRFFEKNWPPQKKLKINPKKHLTFFNYRFILCGLSKLGRVREREILTSGTRKFRNIVNKSSSSK